MNDVTHILSRIEDGDGKTEEELLPLVDDELRKLAADCRLVTYQHGLTLSALNLGRSSPAATPGRRLPPPSVRAILPTRDDAPLRFEGLQTQGAVVLERLWGGGNSLGKLDVGACAAP